MVIPAGQPGSHVAQFLTDRVAACAREQQGDRVPDDRLLPHPEMDSSSLRATQRPHRVVAASPSCASSSRVRKATMRRHRRGKALHRG